MSAALSRFIGDSHAQPTIVKGSDLSAPSWKSTVSCDGFVCSHVPTHKIVRVIAWNWSHLLSAEPQQLHHKLYVKSLPFCLFPISLAIFLETINLNLIVNQSKMPRSRRDTTFVCRACKSKVLEQNRIMHDVVCRRKASKSRRSARGPKSDTSYAHSVYEQYAQGLQEQAAETQELVPYTEPHYQTQAPGSMTYAYSQRQPEADYQQRMYTTPPQSPKGSFSPVNSPPPFPVTPAMSAVGYDLNLPLLPANMQPAPALLPAHRGAHTNEEHRSESYKDCQYCGRALSREAHMTHELACAFTSIVCKRCHHPVRRLDEHVHLQSGCSQAIMSTSTRGKGTMTTTMTRDVTRYGRDVYTTDIRKMAGAAVFALAAYAGSRLLSRRRGGDGTNLAPEQRMIESADNA